MLKNLWLVPLFLFIGACAQSLDMDDDTKLYQGMSEGQLFNSAVAQLKSKDYSSAIKRFEAMESMFPVSLYSKNAHLDLIYAYFQNGDYLQAAATADRYIHLYPRDKTVDYAYYMKGVANFEQQRGTFARFLKMDVTWRYPGTQWQAYQDFSNLVKRFPHSVYYRDSIQRMVYLRNQFAQRELNIASFYMERKAYVAALNRANYLIRHYGQSPQAKKAILLTKKIDATLKLHQGSSDANKVLNDTYPKA